MPNTSAPSNLEAIPDWYASISFVQPPVKAAGKNARMTGFLPLKSDSLTGLPAVDGKVKSGAASPTFRCVLGGAAGCAQAQSMAVDTIAAASLIMHSSPPVQDLSTGVCETAGLGPRAACPSALPPARNPRPHYRT